MGTAGGGLATEQRSKIGDRDTMYIPLALRFTSSSYSEARQAIT